MPDTRTRTGDLLSPAFMRQLERLDVLSRKVLRGTMQGERRSKKKGISVEFADYRPYVVGDDLRFIDWNLYARLDKLFLRLFMEEEDMAVTLVIDSSRSMDYGDPNKLDYAKRLAAAIAYISLVQYNRLSLFSFENELQEGLTQLRGRRPIPQMLEFLNGLEPAEKATAESATDMEAVCRRLSMIHRQPGIVVVLGDFFDKGDVSEAMRHLMGPARDVYALQLLSPQELDPVKGQVVGDLRLLDREDEDAADVSVSPALIKKYKANLQAYCEHVRQECIKRGILYLMTPTDVAVETVVLRYLRQRGLLA